jgi:kynurenine aminotransferase
VNLIRLFTWCSSSPHNPLGKVFDEEELLAIGHLAEEFNLLILSDEVYDVMTLDDSRPHIRMASLENFWERTITVGSGGKAFAATGYRVGWMVGPEHLISESMPC